MYLLFFHIFLIIHWKRELTPDIIVIIFEIKEIISMIMSIHYCYTLFEILLLDIFY